MTTERFILDTVAAIAILNENADIEAVVGQLNKVSLPIITIGELFHGAEKSRRTVENIEKVNRLIQKCNVLLCDIETAREYGRIEFMLRQKGRSIPQNDMWIAAIARQNNLTLVTRDAHFNEIDGLAIQTW